ncbi:MAG: UDP-glucose/GDP-mannose dehydrogenase family protein [Gemmatimonadetes bacterium]|nr:UDP-glucose/GDP-mannose dehydrogenase family protein [Gemmatimonadota bacterium]
MNVAVVGTGYVGLVAGACLAETGNRVTCVDIDERKVADLRRGEIPIYEPGLEEIVRRNVGAGRLVFTTELEGAVRSARVVFIAVGTPPDEDGSADLQHVLAVAQGIGRAMVGETVVVTKSTVPVGTARRVREAIEAETDQPVHVCSNPEFLKEGDAVDDFMKPDRVVVGVDHPAAEAALRELYGPFLRTGNALMVMDIPSAEITKYAANAMLATRISFMNTIAQLCERTGANVDAVRRGVGSDARIGSAFLFPGVGYGGSCFPKDVKALIRTSREIGASASILEAVEQVNADQKRLLLERGARIAAHDPEAGDEARRIFGDRIDIRDSNYDALDGASALLIHTEWLPYRRPDFDAMRERLARPILFDGRNLYAPVEMARRGFEYHSIGRRPVGIEAAEGAS